MPRGRPAHKIEKTLLKPNIVLILTDQQRGDCLGLAGHPVLQTPYLDSIAAGGVWFRRAYSACPVCIPARRTIMTGRSAASHGVVHNALDIPLEGPWLAEELSQAGYQTHLVGKLHLFPRRKRYGFDSSHWADAAKRDTVLNDYHRFLQQNGFRPEAATEHGCHFNGWVSRPWHLPEHLHFTNWCVTSALEFLERRDPTTPFFLNVSFHAPHQPCTPPSVYYDRYMSMDLPEPWVSDWSKHWDKPPLGLRVDSDRTALSATLMKQYRAGYFGAINHIDDQVGRLMQYLPANTIIVFASDHGEMLGDHQWIRKSAPYESSAHVPMFIRLPDTSSRGLLVDHAVELMDIMPTLLDLAGAPVPASVEGRSLVPFLNGQVPEWREYLHGECSSFRDSGGGMQYLTDGKWKYIWLPGPGREQFFNLEDDPREMHDLSQDAVHCDAVAVWRQRLIGRLQGRPEGFVEKGKLVTLGRATPAVLASATA